MASLSRVLADVVRVVLALVVLALASTRALEDHIEGSHRRKHRHRDLIVDTDKGRVRGIRYYLPTLGNKAVDAYLGIPFAKKPEGHLRFKHPQPMDPWDGVFNATKLPYSCYQAPDTAFGDFSGSTMWNPTTKISEDCLYLNVWVPRTHPKLRNSAVLVWVFGGGFYSGTSTLNLYDGKILAAENNIIVVSMNYRVGPLGFLALNHPSAPGNAGMFDQLMALDWVQHNIKKFGGDPNNVTLFGESAGSLSVSLHLISPLSRRKFNRAIMQSGTANMEWGTYDMDEAKRRSLEFATSYLGCPKSDNMEDIVHCLRYNIQAQTLVEQQWVARGIIQFPFLPVIDGVFLTESPKTSLERKSFKKCPVLLGSNLNEGSFFLIYELHDYIKLNISSMTREQFISSINLLFFHYPQFPQINNHFGLNAIEFRYTNWYRPNDKYTNIKALENAVGDCHFTCNVNRFAHSYASAGENVYSYYFTHRYSSNAWPKWMGVLHGDEILFVFGEPLKEKANFTRDEQALSRKMMAYWTNFAKSGDPNRTPGRPSLNEWPMHTPNNKEFLELNTKTVLSSQGLATAVGQGPRSQECAFWTEYLPQLVASSAKYMRGTPPPTAAQTCNAGASSLGVSVLAALLTLLILAV